MVVAAGLRLLNRKRETPSVIFIIEKHFFPLFFPFPLWLALVVVSMQHENYERMIKTPNDCVELQVAFKHVVM